MSSLDISRTECTSSIPQSSSDGSNFDLLSSDGQLSSALEVELLFLLFLFLK